MVAKKEVKDPQRVYNNTITLDSDLFKLEVSFMEKNMGVDGQKPSIEKIEHCHFYRTYDSSGKKLDNCSYIGGHTHTITPNFDDDGKITAKCSTPIWSYKTDTHTHEVRYIKSDKVQKRRINADAIREIDKFNTI